MAGALLGALAASPSTAGASAAAQPSPPATETPGQAAPQPGPAALPTSPAEAAAQRKARLDSLFARLAKPNSTDWLSVQDQIWRIWSHSGSPSMDLLLERADKAMKNGDTDLALSFLDDLVRLDPGFAEGWNKRATVYFKLGEYGRAVADIERTLALEPRQFGALAGLGTILERLGDKKGAYTAYKAALSINPNLPGAAEAVKRLAPDVEGRPL